MNINFTVCEKPEVSRRKWTNLVNFLKENPDKAVTIPYTRNDRNNCVAAARVAKMKVHTRKDGDNLIVWRSTAEMA